LSGDAPLPLASVPTALSYHAPSAPIHAAFEPVASTAPTAAEEALETMRRVEETRADKSKRFLSSKLYYSGSEIEGGATFFTFTSSNSTWATVCNGITFGLSAPLCRVYFVEIMFQDQIISGEERIRQFLEHELGFIKSGEPTTGEELVRWLEYQQKNEMRRFGFEKIQGNSFAVYLVTMPKLSGRVVDTAPLRRRTERRYKVLDGVDNVIMLGGRVWISLTENVRVVWAWLTGRLVP
jgi:hypothetical protein